MSKQLLIVVAFCLALAVPAAVAIAQSPRQSQIDVAYVVSVKQRSDSAHVRTRGPVKQVKIKINGRWSELNKYPPTKYEDQRFAYWSGPVRFGKPGCKPVVVVARGRAGLSRYRFQSSGHPVAYCKS